MVIEILYEKASFYCFSIISPCPDWAIRDFKIQRRDGNENVA